MIAIANQDARINVGALTVQYSYVGYVIIYAHVFLLVHLSN